MYNFMENQYKRATSVAHLLTKFSFEFFMQISQTEHASLLFSMPWRTNVNNDQNSNQEGGDLD